MSQNPRARFAMMAANVHNWIPARMALVLVAIRLPARHWTNATFLERAMGQRDNARIRTHRQTLPAMTRTHARSSIHVRRAPASARTKLFASLKTSAMSRGRAIRRLVSVQTHRRQMGPHVTMPMHARRSIRVKAALALVPIKWCAKLKTSVMLLVPAIRRQDNAPIPRSRMEPHATMRMLARR